MANSYLGREDELVKILKTVSERFKDYPQLVDLLDSLAMEEVRSSEQKALDQIGMLIKFELAYLNTNHPDFDPE